MAARDDVVNDRGNDLNTLAFASRIVEICGVSDLPSRRQIGDDGHYYECEVCYNGGVLLCCESCPRVYHLECLVPPMECIPLEDWYCRYCDAQADLLEPIATMKPLSSKKKHAGMNKLERSSKNSMANRSSTPVDENAVNQSDEGKCMTLMPSKKDEVIVYRRSRIKGHVKKGEKYGSTKLPKVHGPLQKVDDEIRDEHVQTILYFAENAIQRPNCSKIRSMSSECANNDFKHDASGVGMEEEMREGIGGAETPIALMDDNCVENQESKGVSLKHVSVKRPRDAAQDLESESRVSAQAMIKSHQGCVLLESSEENNGAEEKVPENHHIQVQIDSDESLSKLDLKYTPTGKAYKEKYAKLRARQKTLLASSNKSSELHRGPCIPVRKVASALEFRTGSERKNSSESQMMLETWREDELDALWVGVRRHGKGHWEEMLKDPKLHFSKDKTPKVLSERWERERFKLLKNKTLQEQKQQRADFAPPLSQGTHHQVTSSRGFKKIRASEEASNSACSELHPVKPSFTFYPCEERSSSGQNLLLGGLFLLPHAQVTGTHLDHSLREG